MGCRMCRASEPAEDKDVRDENGTKEEKPISWSQMEMDEYQKSVLNEHVDNNLNVNSVTQNQTLVPLSNVKPKAFGLKPFSFAVVNTHNEAVGWIQWAVFRRRIYDLEALRKNKELMNAINERIQDEYSDEVDLNDDEIWKTNVIDLMQEALFSEEEIRQFLNDYAFGRIQSDELWGKFRLDAVGLEQELSKSESTKGTKLHYRNQLRRWLDLYKDKVPDVYVPVQGDPNFVHVFLPKGVNPEIFRSWIVKWQPFSTQDAELELRPLTDLSKRVDPDILHAQFAQTLRGLDQNLEDFNHKDPQWETLPSDVVKHDIMTPKQQEIDSQRRARPDFHDLGRMRRRRKVLAKYFVKRYRMSFQKLEEYLKWSDIMTRDFDKLLALSDYKCRL